MEAKSRLPIKFEPELQNRDNCRRFFSTRICIIHLQLIFATDTKHKTGTEERHHVMMMKISYDTYIEGTFNGDEL